MQIIISPAKKMQVDTDTMAPENLPQFLGKTQTILGALQSMTDEALQNLWQCNDAIATQNIQRLTQMDLTHGLTPAILAYQGIQYQYMAPNVFETTQFSYIQQHLRILSAFYGILRPLDGVAPYRLEMQAKLKIAGHKNLYQYWGSALAEQLTATNEPILNLASKEYSKAVASHLPKDYPFVTCSFVEPKGDKLAEKATMCKMARGSMVRYLAECDGQTMTQVKQFNQLDFQFSQDNSSENTLVFIKKENKLC